jgi:hypothetical protein
VVRVPGHGFRGPGLDSRRYQIFDRLCGQWSEFLATDPEVRVRFPALPNFRPPLWSSGRSSWLRIQRSRVRFRVVPDFLRSSGSGTGSTQPRVRIIEELLEWKSSCFGQENQINNRGGSVALTTRHLLSAKSWH